MALNLFVFFVCRYYIYIIFELINIMLNIIQLGKTGQKCTKTHDAKWGFQHYNYIKIILKINKNI